MCQELTHNLTKLKKNLKRPLTSQSAPVLDPEVIFVLMK